MLDKKQDKRVERTREKIRSAALRLFLEHGFLGTSTDAIMVAAGISSKETLYRHYASKEELFVDVLSHLTLEQPAHASMFSDIPTPHDLTSLRNTLVMLSRELLTLMMQPEYHALVRVIMTDLPRFPQLGPLFRTIVPQRGLNILAGLLRQAREQNIIADVDFDAVTRALLGGLVTYALLDVLLAREDGQPPSLEQADALVDVIMPALTPR